MNRGETIRRQLARRGIVASAESADLTISLSTGAMAESRRQLTRRFHVSKRGTPFLSVRVLPRPWPFAIDDLLSTYNLYNTFEELKVPRLIDHFVDDDADYFVEEYIPSATSLQQLVESGEVGVEEGADVARRVLTTIWQSGDIPSADFAREQVAMIRHALTEFFHSGALGAFLADCVEKGLVASASSWKRVLSTGDIIDRNLLRANGSWYLVDFEYCHPTLFFFKEAYRLCMYGTWARDLPIDRIFPFVPDLPAGTLELVSLAWEAQLADALLEPATRQRERERLWRVYWDVLDSRFGERLDDRLKVAGELRVDLEKRIARQQQQHTDLQQQHTDLHRQHADLQQQATAERLALGAEVEVLKQRCAAVERENAEKRDQRDEAVQQLATSREEVLGLRNALVAARADQESGLEQTERLRAQLAEQAAHLFVREQLIERIFRSLSWRMTGPLRWLDDRIRQLLGRTVGR